MRLPEPIELPNNRQDRPYGQIDDMAFKCYYDQPTEAFLQRFMDEYAGDPYYPSILPEIISEEGIVYDRARVSSISERGNLLHVRETTDSQAPSELRYKVITGNIDDQKVIDDWRVKVRHQADHLGRVTQTDLILTRGNWDLHEGTAHLPHDFDDPATELAWREHDRKQRLADRRLARVMLAHERFAFKPFDGQPEALTSLIEIKNSLARLESRLGRAACRSVQPAQAPSSVA